MVETAESGFRDVGVLRMFPSFVWRAELDPETRASVSGAVERALAGLGAPLDGLRPGESWQSDHGLHELEGLAGLVACIERAAADVLDRLRVAHEGFALTGCWANVNAPGAAHRAHAHPNNYLSGAYYVRTRAGADTVNFHDPRPQAAVIRPPVRELTAENADQVVVTVADGTLLLFPAWLQHSVDPNRSGRIRISVSFNIMLASYAGTMSRPAWTGGRRGPAGQG